MQENRGARGKLVGLTQAIASIPWGEGRTIEEVLETKRVGTCTGKHLVLAACFDALGLLRRTPSPDQALGQCRPVNEAGLAESTHRGAAGTT